MTAQVARGQRSARHEAYHRLRTLRGSEKKVVDLPRRREPARTKKSVAWRNWWTSPFGSGFSPIPTLRGGVGPVLDRPRAARASDPTGHATLKHMNSAVQLAMAFGIALLLFRPSKRTVTVWVAVLVAFWIVLFIDPSRVTFASLD